MQHPPCNLCGADDAEPVVRGQDWGEPKLAPYSMVRCRQCGLIYLNPRPSPDEIGAFYMGEYLPFRTAIEDDPSTVLRWMKQRHQTRLRRAIEKYSGLPTGNILDVGCATGLFLHEMASAGWQTAGVELTPQAARYARERFGLDVFEGVLADAPYEAASFDAITFWDVLEHTYSPTDELHRAAALLKPGGLLAINVPNANSFDRAWFGPQWVGYDAPRHLYLFSQQTLAPLLGAAGFEVLQWQCFMSSYFAFAISLERSARAHKHLLATLTTKMLNFPGTRFLFEPYLSLMNSQQRGVVISVFARKR